MTEVSLKVGDMVHTPGGRDGRIAEFLNNETEVRVNFAFGNQTGRYKVTEVRPTQSPLMRSPKSSTVDTYTFGKILTNVAGESAKVINQWQDMVKLQPLSPLSPPATQGENNGAKTTDFEPRGAPFTLSEQDADQWLLKWLKAGDVVELVDGQVVILGEMPVGDRMTEAVQREYRIGLQFSYDNPLARNTGSVSIEMIKSKVTASVAQAFRILAEPGSTHQQQQTIDSLRAECTLLHRQVDELKASPPRPSPQAGRGQSDEVAKAVEDAAKAKAALLDAEKRIRNLEYTNQQQSKLLSKAAALPNPSPQSPPQSISEGTQHVLTLVSIGGNAGFGNIEVPSGYQVAAITTELDVTLMEPQIYRLVHLIGCGNGNNQPLYEEKAERIPVMDDAPENSFEAALKGGLAPEDVITVGNERVIDMAWEAAEKRRATHPSTHIPMMLTGGHDD